MFKLKSLCMAVKIVAWESKNTPWDLTTVNDQVPHPGLSYVIGKAAVIPSISKESHHFK